MRTKIGTYYINYKDFDDYKAWCGQNKLNPSHADSSFKYHAKLKRDKFIATHDVKEFAYETIKENRADYADGYTMFTENDMDEIYLEQFDEFVSMLMEDEDLAKEFEL
jgi:hypothetical protein